MDDERRAPPGPDPEGEPPPEGGPILDESDDIVRVKEAYGIEEFPYRVWPEEKRLPDPQWTLAYAGLEETMAKQSAGPKGAGAPIPWEMPEDLRATPLPILSRMGEMDMLIYELRRRDPHPVSEATSEEALPELREAAREVTEPVLPPLGGKRRRASEGMPTRPTPPAPAQAAAAETEEAEAASSARNKLRSLALKGVKNA